MTAPPMSALERREGTYTGWVISLLIIVVVLGVGAGLWFTFHP